MDIPNQKKLVHHVRIPTVMPVETKETLKAMKNIKDTSPKIKDISMNIKEFKEDKEINKSDHMGSKTEIILNYDSSAKEQAKSTDKNCKQLTHKTKRKVDITNNTSVFPVK